MKVKSIEERVAALEQKAGVEKAELSKVKDEEANSVAINDWIRKRYTLTEEIAILRKTLKLLVQTTGISAEEFNEYNAFVESHKAKVKLESKGK